ncbi:hypothetical protein L1049_016010 [Liquidambar formosana]|uniref:RNase H type-1 domain-containing protein n=1 Tax=Liquidambar formosana TaxID=63359 RepID=A0AAP0R657_LIQFO
MKRYRNGEIWVLEHEMPVSRDGSDVILGLDGRTTSTVCICMPIIPFSHNLPDPLPVLARAVAGCSNNNSVGELLAVIFGIGQAWEKGSLSLWIECDSLSIIIQCLMNPTYIPPSLVTPGFKVSSETDEISLRHLGLATG